MQIAALLDQADVEHAQVREAIGAQTAMSFALQQDVTPAAWRAVQEAFTELQGALTDGCVTASARPTWRGHRSWHERMFLAREPVVSISATGLLFFFVCGSFASKPRLAATNGRNTVIRDSVASSAPRRSMIPTLMVWFVLAAIVILTAKSFLYQWDFRVFYYAPKILSLGGTPYDQSNSLPGLFDWLKFLYPPLTLYIFRPLGWIQYREAYLLWLALKLVALFFLFRLWNRGFDRLYTSWPIVVFLALAYNCTILRDLVAGNISIFEELGIWLGFYLLIRGKPYRAGLTLAVIAQFKMVPIVLLGTLLFMPGKRWGPFAVSLATFSILFSLNFLIAPDLTTQYIHMLTSAVNPNLDERGVANPSSLALLRDLCAQASLYGLHLDERIANIAYVFYVSLMSLIFVWLPRARIARIAATSPSVFIYYACVLYVLTMPRMKDYSYIILLLPTLFAVRHILKTKSKDARLLIVAVALVAIQPPDSFIPLLKQLMPWLIAYSPWFAAWWVLYYIVDWESQPADPSITATSGNVIVPG